MFPTGCTKWNRTLKSVYRSRCYVRSFWSSGSKRWRQFDILRLAEAEARILVNLLIIESEGRGIFWRWKNFCHLTRLILNLRDTTVFLTEDVLAAWHYRAAIPKLYPSNEPLVDVWGLQKPLSNFLRHYAVQFYSYNYIFI